MNKYIAAFALACALTLPSCSNDDIPVYTPVTFKLNPATVVDNLYEMNAGDLTSLTSGNTLNVGLYVYDSSGRLIEQDTGEFSGYTHMMTSNFGLSNGDYTIVAISYVSSTVEFWTLEDIKDINTLKIVDNGYIGGKSKILGLTVKRISVSPDNNLFNIDIQNAGAVACVAILNWNRYSDVAYFGLASKQSCDYISTNNLGSVEYSVNTKTTYGYYKVKLQYTSNTTGGVAYFFTFPIKNAAMKFFAETTGGTTNYLGANLVDDINLGDSYLIGYDVADGETIWIDKTPARSKVSADDSFLQQVADSQPRAVYDYENLSISIRP